MQEKASSSRRWCYGCGEDNPEGLRIAFRVDGRCAVGQFTPREVHQGYPGLAHGGVAAAALDEAMGWAIYGAGAWAVTARMEVRYRRPLPLGQELVVSAEVTRSRGRWLEVKGEIRAPSGELLAESKGVFLRLLQQRGKELEAYYRADQES